MTVRDFMTRAAGSATEKREPQRNIANKARLMQQLFDRQRFVPILAACLLAFAGVCGHSKTGAAEPETGVNAGLLAQTRSKAVDFLRNTQADDGSWTTPNAPGIAGLVVTALLNSGVPLDDPAVQRGLTHLEGFIHDDGGVYFSESNHRNYETCIAILAFGAANAEGRYDKQIKHAEQFLRHLQWDEGEGLESSDTAYGGAGYGSHQRPDLSNTQFLLEALKAAGAGPDDPAIQKALVFVSRSQNLESEANNTPFAAKINDGGFYYTPAAGGTSQAGTDPNGGLRSYGSMTYAGLKSMIYAGLTDDDPRVKAAVGWLQKHYTLEQNPGMGQQGLYYYYHTFAKGLDATGLDRFEDTTGKQHDWRAELVAQLAKLQQENGSWINPAERWYEGDPNLVTAYALLALSYCGPEAASPRDDGAAAHPPKPQLSEKQKIEALIGHVEQLKGAVFIRNGFQHSAAAAAQHLRAKLNADTGEVKTARDFIEKLASTSSATGKPYFIRLKNQKDVKSGEYLLQQLRKIEDDSADKAKPSP
jgi:squalene-hopene/tetraprenyl-beta-curcumene cyclase